MTGSNKQSPSCATCRRSCTHQAYHDPLTGLANRALFGQQVHTALESSAERGIAVLFIDLDDFKTVNDTLGHAVGDQLLRAAGRRLTRCIRAGDLVARLGGDEFAILCQPSRRARACRRRRCRAGPEGVPAADLGRQPSAAGAAECRRGDQRPSAAGAPRTCYVTPMSRCTRPRRPARAATRSSIRRCATSSCAGTGCARNSSARSSTGS